MLVLNLREPVMIYLGGENLVGTEHLMTLCRLSQAQTRNLDSQLLIITDGFTSCGGKGKDFGRALAAV